MVAVRLLGMGDGRPSCMGRVRSFLPVLIDERNFRPLAAWYPSVEVSSEIQRCGVYLSFDTETAGLSID